MEKLFSSSKKLFIIDEYSRLKFVALSFRRVLESLKSKSLAYSELSHIFFQKLHDCLKSQRSAVHTFLFLSDCEAEFLQNENGSRSNRDTGLLYFSSESERHSVGRESSNPLLQMAYSTEASMSGLISNHVDVVFNNYQTILFAV